LLSRVGIRGHGTESSAPFYQTAWVVSEWRNGKCTRSHAFLSEAEALEAVGLSE
jgi:hypothetical protein